jgi:hypothetical protein
MLPSYRERVVQVRFAPEEGGLNLAMEPETIEGIKTKGRQAGEKLRDFNFDHHRWIRFRVLMAQLETQLRGTRRAFASKEDYNKLLQAQRACQEGMSKFAYARDEAWCNEALPQLEALLALIQNWEEADSRWQEINCTQERFFSEKAPEPKPILRVTPEL